MTLAEQSAPAPQEGSGPAAGYRFGETEDYRLGPQLGTPDLTIKKAQEGPFFYSMTGSYLLFVSNLGPGATTGQIVAYDLLPPTLTPVSATGTGWACSIVGQLVTCTHSRPACGRRQLAADPGQGAGCRLQHPAGQNRSELRSRLDAGRHR